MKGRWPSPEVDHINRKPFDNRWQNLREANHSINGRNQNNSGRIGVSFNHTRGRYEAKICINSRRLFLGRFDSFDAACEAREAAERRYGFSLGHGRVRLRTARR
jgi:hypothetical protein